ncbi:MAG: hypothetical protein RLZZ488_311 [Pseudomonadota bacterium]|jgi:hypothetical protein
MVKNMKAGGLIVLAAFMATACKPRTFNAGIQSTGDAAFTQQFEVTRFSTCKDSKGNESGGFDFVWRLRKENGEAVTPYILGFAATAQSLDGQKVEFRSVSTIDEPRYRVPEVKPAGSFPVEKYLGLSLQYPDSELKSGWGFQKINGKDAVLSDVTGATLLLPKNKEAGAFASRYFIVLPDGKSLEFNCQPISDAVRERMRTYLVSNGEHGFKGDRGPVVGGAAKPTPSPVLPAGFADLRPPGRPAGYDVQFRHERIYDCGSAGAVDVIWRKAESNGTALAANKQYILGFAASLNDPQQKKSIAFSSVSIDSAPAFFAGSAPSPVSYLSPAFEFTAEEIKAKLSFHSPVQGLAAGLAHAAAGTLWVPYAGDSGVVSVAISTESTLRGRAFQVMADCTAKRENISNLITGCVGRQSAASCPR